MGALCADAGEAIVVPTEKGKPGPSQAASKAAARDLFKFRDIAPSGTPFDALAVPLMPEKRTPLDPKEEKRRKLERLERENWMVVGQGELQAEEEEKNFLNVRDYSLDDLDKDNNGNLMFRDLKKDGTRHPGQFRSSTDAARQASQRVAVSSEGEADARRPERDPRLGSHMSSELNLQKMFEPRQTGDSLSPRFHKSDLTLQGLLNSGGNTELTRGQQARREEFRSFLDKPAGANPLAGRSDPINSRSDFTRQPFNPTMPQSSPYGAGSFGSASSLTRPGSSFGGYPSAGANSANGSLFNSQNDSRTAKPAATLEPPRRRF